MVGKSNKAADSAAKFSVSNSKLVCQHCSHSSFFERDFHLADHQGSLLPHNLFSSSSLSAKLLTTKNGVKHR